MDGKKKEYRIGYFCAFACAILWGLLPAYWKSLEAINSFTIMFYRLILAFLFVFIISLFKYGISGILEPLKQKRVALYFALAGVIITVNWGIYIWAVTAGHIIQTSIGYYLQPLFVAVLGVLIFHERFNKYKATAVILAVIGIGVMIISFGQPPTLAIALGSTFAVYAAIKKKLNTPALLSLLYETCFMLPIIIPCTIYMEVTGQGAFSADIFHILLLSLAGILTATPLILFGMAANRIKIITLGMTQYIAPSMALIIGIFIYSEPFDLIKLTGFIILWIGLGIFTVGEIKDAK